uniref:OSJNBa0004L19.4 protein n=1 Tax=Oryza sativa subsp. japonica TaxID=39947 RepID=Q7X8R1_ORYSJ|nr:OSJNBa0004L19.4 [Oryza sativa Japonica Group]
MEESAKEELAAAVPGSVEGVAGVGGGRGVLGGGGVRRQRGGGDDDEEGCRRARWGSSLRRRRRSEWRAEEARWRRLRAGGDGGPIEID